MPLLGFLSATLFWPGLPSEALAPRWAAIAVGVPLVSALNLQFASAKLLCLWGGGLMLAALSLLWSVDPLGGALDLYRLALIGLVMLAARQLSNLDRTMAGVGWGLAISAGLCLFQIFGLSPVDQAAAPAGLFVNRDILAEAAAPVFVWAFLTRRWVLAVWLVIPLILSGSRVGLLATGAGIFAISTAKIRITAYALVGCLLAAFVISLDPGKVATAWARIEIWRSALGMIRPFGAGLGSFASTYPGYEYAHSDLLQIVAELGLGAVPFIALAFVLVRASWRVHPAIRAAAVVLGIECIVSFPLHLPTTAFLAGVLAGGMVGCGTGPRFDEPYGSVSDGEPLWADPLAVATRYRFRDGSEDFPVRSPTADDSRHSEKFNVEQVT